mgnify:CR=1 FL=1
MELFVFLIVVLIFSIILHEVSHGYAAYALGDPTAKLAGRLTLNPIPHIDVIGSIVVPGLLVLTQTPFLFGWAKPVPYNPHNLSNQRWGEALVAIAGSATNLLLALIFGLIARFGADLGLGSAFVELSALVVFVNLFLGIFNLIPIPPLDGYTFLRAILPYRFAVPLEQFQARIQSMGFFGLFLILFVFLFLLAQPFFYFVYTIFSLLTGMTSIPF